MIKIQKLRILAVAFFLMAGLAAFSPPPAYAEKTLGQRLLDLCAKKVDAGTKDSKTLACAYGYTLAISDKGVSGCNDEFKGKNKEIQACKTGYNLGKQDPLNAKDQGKEGGDNKDGNQGAAQGGNGGQGNHCNSEDNCDLVKLYINPFIRLLSVAVGLVIVASLIMGGIQYSASSGDPQKASAAKSRITNTLLAFFAYAFMYAFLNFLIPGGVF